MLYNSTSYKNVSIKKVIVIQIYNYSFYARMDKKCDECYVCTIFLAASSDDGK